MIIYNCSVCKYAAILMGKRFFMPLFGRTYSKISLDDIQPLLKDLDLVIVGGLHRKGYTNNDIDLVGNKRDVPLFVERLKKKEILNPVHYCNNSKRHSHIKSIYYGIKLALTGKGY